MLHQLQMHRQIFFHLANDYLEPLSGNFERLAYLAGLRDLATGVYHHERLEAAYGAEAVSEVAEKSHEELFERVLETPLSEQETDFRTFLQTQPGGGQTVGNSLEDRIQKWIPTNSPDYLKDLFRSNLDAFRELIQTPPTKVRSNK
jgi:hypothetical protein